MMRWIAALLISLLAGCSAHTRVDATSSNATSSVGVHVQGGSLSTAIMAAVLVAGAVEYSREERPFPSFSTFSDWVRGAPAPELDPGRRISEQDCTRPLDHSLGNIRCR